VNERRFEISYSPTVKWLFLILGMGPSLSGVLVDDETIQIRMGWAFRSVIPRTSLRSIRPDVAPTGGWGVHGWRSEWLVNASSTGMVLLRIDPPARTRAVGFRVGLRTLRLSIADRDAFITLVEQPDETLSR
jgi:hypothetical protein